MINNNPHSLEAEQAVIGAFLSEGLKKDSILTIFESLKAESFYNQLNADTFEAITELYEAHTAVDLVSVVGKLPGAKSYLIELVKHNSRSSNLSYWSQTVIEKSKERMMRDALLMAYNTLAENDTHSNKIDRVEDLLKTLSDSENVSNMQSLNDIIVEQMDVLDKRFNSSEPIGLQTGYTDLDEHIGGLRPGQLITLGARTSVGKSALGFNIAEHISSKNINTLYITMEMTKGELAERSICSQGRVNNRKIRDMQGLTENDWTSISHGAQRSAKLSINIIEMTRPSVNQIKAFARAVKRKGKLDFLVIDHLHLMNHMNPQSEVSGIANTTADLKALALELQVPILLMAQLNRGNAKENRRPTLTDLRGSGSIEQDSDGVYLIHRDDEDDEMRGKALILIEKNRAGEKDVAVVLSQNLQFYRFDNFANIEGRY